MKQGDRVRLRLSKCSAVEVDKLASPVMDADGSILTLERKVYLASFRQYVWYVSELVYWVFERWLVPLTTEELSHPDPKNNDGRRICWWCPGVPTEKRGGGAYDLCLECGR